MYPLAYYNPVIRPTLSTVVYSKIFRLFWSRYIVKHCIWQSFVENSSTLVIFHVYVPNLFVFCIFRILRKTLLLYSPVLRCVL